ncbi:uncharacterized protein LOC134826641 [Bolinopsis microptera]|uniref:uncharacterized protein LOC134826641 n=1 Tax=Bolinopsis microptera TaxID=2820187 RepID=UPI00307AB692
MELRVVVIFILNTIACRAYISQECFCDSEIVVKAKILPEGFIEKNTAKGSKKEKPVVGAHERLYEIAIIEVFRGALGRQLERSLHYAKSRKPDLVNYDADGCDFYQENAIALFHFDTVSDMTIKKFCKGWYYVKEFERNALRRNLYDCDCEIEDCFNRFTEERGIPEDCPASQMDQILCTWDYRQSRCLWKGAKKTCVREKRAKPNGSPPNRGLRRSN